MLSETLAPPSQAQHEDLRSHGLAQPCSRGGPHTWQLSRPSQQCKASHEC